MLLNLINRCYKLKIKLIQKFKLLQIKAHINVLRYFLVLQWILLIRLKYPSFPIRKDQFYIINYKGIFKEYFCYFKQHFGDQNFQVEEYFQNNFQQVKWQTLHHQIYHVAFYVQLYVVARHKYGNKNLVYIRQYNSKNQLKSNTYQIQ